MGRWYHCRWRRGQIMEGGRLEAGSRGRGKARTLPPGLLPLLRWRLEGSRKTSGGWSSPMATLIARIDPAPQGVACQTGGEFPRGGSEDMTNGTTGGGGQIPSPMRRETSAVYMSLGRTMEATPPQLGETVPGPPGEPRDPVRTGGVDGQGRGGRGK